MTVLAPNDHRHGTANGYRLGDRCPACTAANTRRVREQIRDRSENIDPDDPRHGTNSFYNNHGCRCDPCCEAHRIYLAAHPRRRVGATR